MDQAHPGLPHLHPAAAHHPGARHCLQCWVWVWHSGVAAAGILGGCGGGDDYCVTQAATGVRVRGYEVNRQWWEGTHSTPHYITMGQYYNIIEEYV